MNTLPYWKYTPYKPVHLPDRTWPDKTITQAPIWCSVDLRDGNQALINPMSVEQKFDFFKELKRIGFTEIEIGFPSAAQTEFDFTRLLVQRQVLDGITCQVLCQARAELIERTFEAIDGVPRVIFHLYNSTSRLQRDVVFGKSKNEIIAIAVEATKLIKEKAADFDGEEFRFQYSPESFTGTELEFAKDICEAVMEVWQPTPDRPIILNLPATVEMSTPNIHADQFEWFHTQIKQRESVILSVHPHNDRGCAVAATELALMAGADRVEGTLFGNGERTGNVDIVTLACNLYSQGVDPKLDFSEINRIIEIYEANTELEVHPRHPYAGKLVYTAFSGSHQDAIKKGMARQRQRTDTIWEVPYLPIDPKDLGRSYEAIIRVNSQSGKGGAAFVLEEHHGYQLSRNFQRDFSGHVQRQAEQTGAEIATDKIRTLFEQHYLNLDLPYTLGDTYSLRVQDDQTYCEFSLSYQGNSVDITGQGNGPIDALANGIRAHFPVRFVLEEYQQHTLGKTSAAQAAAYIALSDPQTGRVFFGAGVNTNTTRASHLALISALNNLVSAQGE